MEVDNQARLFREPSDLPPTQFSDSTMKLLLALSWALDHPWVFAFVVALVVVMIGAGVSLWRLRKRHTVLSTDLEIVADERIRAVRALRETEVIYHSLVETLPQMILRKDLDGRFTFANQRFCSELGQQPRGDPGQDRL